jgi:hypothetical protein
MAKKYILHLAIALSFVSCQKDPAFEPSDGGFQLAYGKNLVTYGRAVAANPAGEIFAIGSQKNTTTGVFDLYLQKCNQKGALEWEKTFGGAGEDTGEHLILLPDGSLLLLGLTSSKGAGMNDLYLIKVDAQGNLLWDNTYGGPRNDYPTKIKASNDNGFIISGYTESFGAGGFDFYLVKIDGLGNVIWQNTFGGEYDDGVMDFVLSGSGEMFLFGFTDNFGAVGRDFIFAKADRSGNVLWHKLFGGEHYEEAQAISMAPDGTFILAGHSASFGDLEHNPILMKVDAEGNKIWQKSFGMHGHHDGAQNVLASNSGIYSLVRGHHPENAYLYKFTHEGQLQETKTFGGEKNDILYGMAETKTSLILTGFTESYSTHPENKANLFLVKTNK